MFFFMEFFVIFNVTTQAEHLAASSNIEISPSSIIKFSLVHSMYFVHF